LPKLIVRETLLKATALSSERLSDEQESGEEDTARNFEDAGNVICVESVVKVFSEKCSAVQGTRGVLMPGKNFSRKGAKTQSAAALPEVFLCVFASLREK